MKHVGNEEIMRSFEKITPCHLQQFSITMLRTGNRYKFSINSFCVVSLPVHETCRKLKNDENFSKLHSCHLLLFSIVVLFAGKQGRYESQVFVLFFYLKHAGNEKLMRTFKNSILVIYSSSVL